MSPKQRAAKAKKALDHFEKAYVLIVELLKDDDERTDPRPIFDYESARTRVDDTHLIVRALRGNAEREAEREGGEP